MEQEWAVKQRTTFSRSDEFARKQKEWELGLWIATAEYQSALDAVEHWLKHRVLLGKAPGCTLLGDCTLRSGTG